MASSLGKMASGWSSVILTVLSSGAERPAIVVAFPLAKAGGAADREQRLGAATVSGGVEGAGERVDDVARGEGASVLEGDAVPQVEGVGAAVRGNVPVRGQGGFESGVWGEAREAFEHVAHGAAGGNVGGQRGIE